MPTTAAYHERLEALIDDLLSTNDLETTSLASLLMTIQEALQNGSILPLSLVVRRALQEQQNERACLADGAPPSP